MHLHIYTDDTRFQGASHNKLYATQQHVWGTVKLVTVACYTKLGEPNNRKKERITGQQPSSSDRIALMKMWVATLYADGNRRYVTAVYHWALRAHLPQAAWWLVVNWGDFSWDPSSSADRWRCVLCYKANITRHVLWIHSNTYCSEISQVRYS